MKITTQGNGIRIGERLETKITDKMKKFDICGNNYQKAD